jgi:hypothetical protein
MKIYRYRIIAVAVLTQMLTACVALDSTTADGRSVRALVVAQTYDMNATERHSTMAPEGTDPEVAAAAVEAVRARGRDSSAKPGLLDILLGGLGSK